VVCYECLAHSHPSNASTWSWQSVQRAAQTGDAGVRCSRGHLCDTNLLCGAGMCPLSTTSKPAPPPLSPRVSKPVNSLLRSVVLVGLWDSRAGKILSVGSGFVADEKVGLIVTAGHILFQMSEGRKFGTPYFGLKHAKAVIGVIPDGGHTSVFRYFADIVAHDIHNVDACVLRITSRIAKDIEGEGEGCADQPDIPVSIPFGEVPALKMTRKFEMEESVRILGFNQGGEGVLEKGKHVNRSADFAKGYICKKFKAPIQSDDDNSETSSGSTKTFSPREEIVVMCPTISGHSGGPCVNEEGVVVGILSRADPGDRQRCYLVPVSELRTLVRIAKHANPIDLYSYE
jgi:CBS domain-containing protein